MILAGVVACLPQIYVLLTVHLPVHQGNLMGSAPYLYSLLYSIPQSISTLTIGDAVFPIDYVPCLFLLLLAIAFLFSARRIFSDANFLMLFGGAFLGFILLVVTGIGFEGRNAAFLYPITLTLMVLAISRSAYWIRMPAMTVLVLLQMISVFDFVLHRDTAKGSFNTPFAQAMSEISTLSRTCPGSPYVLTHDPVLAYLVEEVGGRVSSPYVPSDATDLSLREKDCVLVVHTSRGVLPPKLYARFMSPLSPEDYRETQTVHLGYDRFHTRKAWIGNETFPGYYITIVAYEALHRAAAPDWYHLSAEE